MRSALVIAAAIAVATATPIKARQPSNAIEACQIATNCEVYTTASGTQAIRFKAGMEPGSADYQRRMIQAKRDNGNDTSYETHVTVGDSKVQYGCGNPGEVQPKLMMGNLDKPCKDTGSCVENEPFTQKINYVKPVDEGKGMAGKQQSVTFQIKATGQYPPATKGAFIQLIQGVADIQVQRFNQNWSSMKRETPDRGQSGGCEVTQQTGFYSVNRFTKDSQSLQGFMTADVSIPDMDKGMCGPLGPEIVGGALAGLIPGIGAGLGAVFGVVVGACNM